MGAQRLAMPILTVEVIIPNRSIIDLVARLTIERRKQHANLAPRPDLRTPPPFQSARIRGRRDSLHRPGHRGQRYHLFDGQPLCAAPRARGQPQHSDGPPHHSPGRMLQRLFLAAVRRSARANQDVLRRDGLLRITARLHRWPRRAGTRVGPSHYRQFLRRRSTGHNFGPRLHQR